MKISYILPTLSVGGAEIQSLFQLKEFVKKGLEVQLIVLSDINFLKTEIDKNIQIDVIHAGHLQHIHKLSILSFFRHRNKLIKFIKEFNPTHVVCHLPVSHLVGRLLKRTTNLQFDLVCYHHSTHYAIYPNNSLKRKIFQWINNRLTKQDTSNLFISEAVKNDVLSNMNVSTYEIIKNAVPQTIIDDSFAKDLMHRFKLETEQYFIVPGRIEPIKGQDIFLESTAKTIKQYNVKVVIAGYGSFTKKLKEIVDQNDIQANVVFTGLIQNKEMLSLIKNSKMVIVPSRYEGLGNVVLEAYTVGKPVLASNSGGLPEVVKHGETGYIYRDKLELTSLFEEIVANQLEKNFDQERILKEFQQHYSLDKQSQKIIQYLKKL